MKKIKPSDLRREAQAMLQENTMPSLEAVLQAVAQVREKYSEQIKASRKQGGTVSKRKQAGKVTNGHKPKNKADGLGPYPIQ